MCHATIVALKLSSLYLHLRISATVKLRGYRKELNEVLSERLPEELARELVRVYDEKISELKGSIRLRSLRTSFFDLPPREFERSFRSASRSSI